MDIIVNYIIFNLRITMNSVIIVGGGKSQRFNSEIPKQFINYNNKSIIEYSINTFLSNHKIFEVIIVIPRSWIVKFKNMYNQCKVVEGGKTRFESMRNGFNAVSNKSKNILIHDAARPLVSNEIINNCINYLDTYDASCPYIDIVDSIISIDNKLVNYLSRDKIKKIQTPQGFKKNILKNYCKNEAYGHDDISGAIYYNKNIDVKFFKGEIENFKITNNIDLHLFKGIVNDL